MSRLLLRSPRFLSPYTTTTTRRHLLTTNAPRFNSDQPRSPFNSGPAPPRLPAKEQEEFERLQRASTGAFSTPRTSSTSTTATPTNAPARPQINQAPASSSFASPERDAQIRGEGRDGTPPIITSPSDVLHPDLRGGARPEFDGEQNPKTGEIGGPKNEPLRWGSTEKSGDWSYNGRVTDF